MKNKKSKLIKFIKEEIKEKVLEDISKRNITEDDKGSLIFEFGDIKKETNCETIGISVEYWSEVMKVYEERDTDTYEVHIDTYIRNLEIYSRKDIRLENIENLLEKHFNQNLIKNY